MGWTTWRKRSEPWRTTPKPSSSATGLRSHVEGRLARGKLRFVGGRLPKSARSRPAERAPGGVEAAHVGGHSRDRGTAATQNERCEQRDPHDVLDRCDRWSGVRLDALLHLCAERGEPMRSWSCSPRSQGLVLATIYAFLPIRSPRPDALALIRSRRCSRVRSVRRAPQAGAPTNLEANAVRARTPGVWRRRIGKNSGAAAPPCDPHADGCDGRLDPRTHPSTTRPALTRGRRVVDSAWARVISRAFRGASGKLPAVRAGSFPSSESGLPVMLEASFPTCEQRAFRRANSALSVARTARLPPREQRAFRRANSACRRANSALPHLRTARLPSCKLRTF